MSSSKSINIQHIQTAVPCHICEDDIPGQHYCIQCKKTLCSHCEQNHRKDTDSKDHKIVPRAQIADFNAIPLFCTIHGEHALFHCEKCDLQICGKCVTGEHQGHVIGDLSIKLESKKKLLQNRINRMQKYDLSKLSKMQKEIVSEKEKYENRIQQITKELEDENLKLKIMYDEKKKHLANLHDKDIATFDVLSKKVKLKTKIYEEKISRYEDAILRNNFPVIFELSKREESLPAISSKQELPFPPSFLKGNIQSIEENLGKVVDSSVSLSNVLARHPRYHWSVFHLFGLCTVAVALMGILLATGFFFPSTKEKLLTPVIVSKFQSPLQGLPSICTTKQGEVWLGGYGSINLVTVDIKGHVQRRRKLHIRPYALASTIRGDIILSPRYEDSKSVSKITSNGMKELVNTHPFRYYGVSITADHNILICTRDGRVVRAYEDGTNVKEVYRSSSNTSALHAVENADGRIFITDAKHSAVVIIDKDGDTLSTITHTVGGQKLGMPTGLAVDVFGNVFCADQENNCVYIVNQKNEMWELVGRSHGIQAPRWLAVANDNNLWITQRDGTVHVVKYMSK